MSSKKVLFLDTVHGILADRLTAAGFICEYEYEADRNEVIARIDEYTGLIIRSRIKIDAEVIDAARNLKWIARSGSGLENIDVRYAEKKNIRVINSPEGNSDAVGEHAIGMLLMMLNNLKQADADVRNGRWNREKNRGYEIAGKTVGIIGYGVMGSSLARKLSGFDCRIFAYDKYKSSFGNNHVQEVSLQKLQEEADIVSIHLPLNAETDYYVDKNFISKFKKKIYFINTSRGRQVRLSDLLDALESGKIMGACLDVLEFEKASLENLEADSDSGVLKRLFECEKVILSPHVAGWTEESYFKLSNVLADKILGVTE